MAPSGSYKVLGILLGAWTCALLANRVWAVTECCPFEYRTYNGTGNNEDNLSWGAASTVRIRSKTSSNYTDGTDAPPGSDRPTAREVLNNLFLAAPNLINDFQANALFSAWAMVVAYDMGSLSSNSSEPLDIPCDQADYFWCGSASDTIAFYRSDHGYANDTSARAPINYATSYVDASIIYGNDEATANSLRTFSGGKLNLTDDELPYLNSDGQTWQMAADMSFSNSPHFFAVLVVLMREHNRRCDELAALSDYLDYSDEAMFQAARIWVSAVIQHITKNDFALKVLGSTPQSFYNVTTDLLPYNSSVDAGLDVFFATAAFRFAHSGVGNYLRLVDSSFEPVDGDGMLLSGLDAAGLAALVQEKGIEPILLGGMLDTNQEIDASFSSSIAMSPLFTVPTFTVQRGRDHGLPTYNDAREAYGLAAKASFSDITSDTTVAGLLEELYGSVDLLDAYVGGVCEDHASGAMVGELFQWSIADQLYRMNVGDRFWHNHEVFLEAVNGTTLTEIIILNTNITYTGTDAMTTVSLTISENCSSDSSNSVQLASSYILAWSISGSDLLLTVSAKDIGSDGMIGLGFGTTVMSGADIIICEIFNSSYAECTDRYGVSSHKEPVLDTSGDLYLPVSELTVDTSSGWTSVTYTRQLDGNDDTDWSILDSDTPVIFSWGTGGVGQHANSDSGSATVNFYSGAADVTTSTDTQTFFILHGAYMLATWLVAVPAGWLAARYLKGRKVFEHQWFEIHATLMGFSAQGVVALAVCGLTATQTMVSVTHTVLGCIVLVYTLLQLASGLMRYRALTGKADNFDKLHTINRRVHKWTGRVLVIIAIVNCWYGLAMMSSKTTLSLGSGTVTMFNLPLFGYVKAYLVPLYLPMLVGLFAVMEVHRHHQLGNINSMAGWLQRSGASERSLPLVGYTLTQFHDRVTRGRKAWVIVHKKIINIQDFMNRHPGGRRLLLDHVGADVSKQFKGIGQQIILPSGMLEPHQHSSTATRILKTLVVGRIVDESEAEDLPAPPELVTGSSRGREFAFAARGSEFHRCKLLSRRRVGGAEARPVWVFTFSWPSTMEPAEEAVALARKGLAFMNLHIAAGKEGAVVERPYNIGEVCHVGAEETVAIPWGGLVVRFHIRLYPDGEMSAVLRDITEGSIAMLQGPFAMPELKLNPPPHYKRLYLLAGGTGVNPMVSLVREYLESTVDEVLGIPLVDYAITLLWQVTSPKDLYDVGRLQALNQQSGGRFTFLILTGRGDAKLGASLPPPEGEEEEGFEDLIGFKRRRRSWWTALAPWRRGDRTVQQNMTQNDVQSLRELELSRTAIDTRHIHVWAGPKRRGSQEPLVDGTPSLSDQNGVSQDPEAPPEADVPMISGQITEELLSEVIGRPQLRRVLGTLRSKVQSLVGTLTSGRGRSNSMGSADGMDREASRAVAQEHLAGSLEGSAQSSPRGNTRKQASPGVPEIDPVLANGVKSGAGAGGRGGSQPASPRHGPVGGGREGSQAVSPTEGRGVSPCRSHANDTVMQRVAAALVHANSQTRMAVPPRMLARLHMSGDPHRTATFGEGTAVGLEELRIVVSGPTGFTQAMQNLLDGMSIPSHVVVLLD